MESKEERKDKAWEKYKKIRDSALEEYLRKCREINEEDEKMETYAEPKEDKTI